MLFQWLICWTTSSLRTDEILCLSASIDWNLLIDIWLNVGFSMLIVIWQWFLENLRNQYGTKYFSWRAITRFSGLTENNYNPHPQGVASSQNIYHCVLFFPFLHYIYCSEIFRLVVDISYCAFHSFIYLGWAKVKDLFGQPVRSDSKVALRHSQSICFSLRSNSH